MAGRFGAMTHTLTDRFWSKVDKNGPTPAHRPDLGPCWVWTRAAHEAGYGRLGLNGKQWRAHRLAWEHAHGAVPAGLFVLHHCDNPRCVKAEADADGPGHLFLGTPADNMRDMARKGRAGRPSGLRNGAYTKPERVMRGEGHPFAKLTTDVVLEIVARSARGENGASIAKRFGVSKNQVSLILLGKAWTHVTGREAHR
jgi:hypothetical protein